jgi:hypothetical protein
MPQRNTTSNNGEEMKVEDIIIIPQKWDINKHTCGVAKMNKNKQGKSVPLSYDGQKFYLRTPKMSCPFGAQRPKPKDGEKEKESDQWSLQMAFDSDKDCQLFQKKAEDFDKFMISEALKPENNVSWLNAPRNKLFNEAVVDSKYKRMVKEPMKDGVVQTNYPSFIRVVFPSTFKEPFELTCEIYDQNNKQLTVSMNRQDPNCIGKIIPMKSKCSALLTGSIWCNSSTGFGVTWRVAQLKVFPPKDSLPKGKCLVGDPNDDDDENNEEATTTTESGEDHNGGGDDIPSVDDPEVGSSTEPSAPEPVDPVPVPVPAPVPAPVIKPSIVPKRGK